MGHFVKHAATLKHGVAASIFQYIDTNALGLNNSPPPEFHRQAEPEAHLDQRTAYYFAFLIRHADFIKQSLGDTAAADSLRILMWYLAEDAVARSQAEGLDRPVQKRGAEKSLEDHYRDIAKSDFWMRFDFARRVR